ncbi:MAG: Smr/MutS family protein [Bacteroidia bacterium]
MVFKVGDKVRFLHEVGEGIILNINGQSALVENNDGFEQEYALSALVLSAKDEDYEIDEHQINSKLQENDFKRKSEALDKKFNHIKSKLTDMMEIDLHIENLIDSHKGMQNYQILEVQMANFRRSLNSAISRRLKKMVVIHGVGEGVLKQEIRKELKEFYPHFDFFDASYQEYGYGATEIELKYK